jgi:hypothetical protein
MLEGVVPPFPTISGYGLAPAWILFHTPLFSSLRSIFLAGVRVTSFQQLKEVTKKSRPAQSLISSKARPNRGRARRVPDAAVPQMASMPFAPNLTVLLPRA